MTMNEGFPYEMSAYSVTRCELGRSKSLWICNMNLMDHPKDITILVVISHVKMQSNLDMERRGKRLWTSSIEATPRWQ